MQVSHVNPAVNHMPPVWLVAPESDSLDDLNSTSCPCICSNIGLCTPIPGGPTCPAPLPPPTAD